MSRTQYTTQYTTQHTDEAVAGAGTTTGTSIRYGVNFSSESIRQRKRRSDTQRLLWHFSVKTPPLLWRTVEFGFALCLAVLVMPFLLPLYLIARLRGGGLWRMPRLGEKGKEFREFALSFGPKRVSNHFLRLLCRLPALANVLAGDMSLVGPRSLSSSELSFRDRALWKRFGLRPGFVGLWWIRKQANIDYDAEAVVDAEYADSKSFQSDLGLLLRSAAAVFFGGAPPAGTVSKTVQLLGLPVHNISMDDAIGEIAKCLEKPGLSRISFVNVDCVNIAQRHAEYAACIRGSHLVLADGIGLKLGANLLRTPICQNVNGTDLLPRLCEKLALSGGGVYLLGGLPGVAEDVARWMQEKYPGLSVLGCQHGFYPDDENAHVKAQIRASEAGILLVAMGAPKQELWIRDHALETGVRVAIGVGGLFDFYSGRMDRAPAWVREIGMEWFFRLCQEPGRMWKRYLVGNFVFLLRILRARFMNPRPVSQP
jgi:N-acetylglucosaminyldiphosphoundecaprenol N-acetyl-beta-D-mannosaminyltransferase